MIEASGKYGIPLFSRISGEKPKLYIKVICIFP
jgi:hypothetical protein